MCTLCSTNGQVIETKQIKKTSGDNTKNTTYNTQ